MRASLAPGGSAAPLPVALRRAVLRIFTEEHGYFLQSDAVAFIHEALSSHALPEEEWAEALEALTGDKISVGAPFFNLTFTPLIVPLLIAVPFGPLLAWKRGDLLAAAQRLMAAACAALAAAVLLLAFNQRGPWLAPLGIGLGIWLVMGALTEIAYRVKLARASPSEAWRRLRNLPRAAYGTALAHAGVGLRPNSSLKARR